MTVSVTLWHWPGRSECLTPVSGLTAGGTVETRVGGKMTRKKSSSFRHPSVAWRGCLYSASSPNHKKETANFQSYSFLRLIFCFNFLSRIRCIKKSCLGLASICRGILTPLLCVIWKFQSFYQPVLFWLFTQPYKWLTDFRVWIGTPSTQILRQRGVGRTRWLQCWLKNNWPPLAPIHQPQERSFFQKGHGNAWPITT